MSPKTIPARTGAYIHLKRGEKLKLINPTGTQVIDFWAFIFPPAASSNNSIDEGTTTTGTKEIPTSFVRSATTNSTPQTTPEPPPPYPFTPGIQYLSASRTRSILSKLIPSATTHDVLYTNKSLPLLTLLQDTTSGIHDTLFGCCDRFRYRNLGFQDYEHASCAENLHVALRAAAAAEEGLMAPGAISEEWAPDPLNVFMNVAVTGGLGREEGGGRIECKFAESRAGEFLVLRAEVDCLAVMSACPNDVIEGVNGGVCRDVEFEVFE